MARYWRMTPAEVNAVDREQYAALRAYMRYEAERTKAKS